MIWVFLPKAVTAAMPSVNLFTALGSEENHQATEKILLKVKGPNNRIH